MEGVDEDEPSANGEGSVGAVGAKEDSTEAESPQSKEQLLLEIISRCEANNPNCGELWNGFTKQMSLRRRSTKDKLLLAVQHVLGFEMLPGTCGFVGQ